MKLALLAAFLLATPALAKGGKGHCVGADGAEMASATSKKECKKAGGKWKKMKKGDTSTAAPK